MNSTPLRQFVIGEGSLRRRAHRKLNRPRVSAPAASPRAPLAHAGSLVCNKENTVPPRAVPRAPASNSSPPPIPATNDVVEVIATRAPASNSPLPEAHPRASGAAGVSPGTDASSLPTRRQPGPGRSLRQHPTILLRRPIRGQPEPPASGRCPRPRAGSGARSPFDAFIGDGPARQKARTDVMPFSCKTAAIFSSAALWICETRLSLMPNMPPISFMVSSLE